MHYQKNQNPKIIAKITNIDIQMNIFGPNIADHYNAL